ncbi:hypothetical protein CBP18_21840, partial [Fischerella thermalis WC119]
MTIANRKKINFSRKAKSKLILTVLQMTLVSLGFLVMLLITNGEPSIFVIVLSFILASFFVVFNQQILLNKSTKKIL